MAPRSGVSSFSQELTSWETGAPSPLTSTRRCAIMPLVNIPPRVRDATKWLRKKIDNTDINHNRATGSRASRAGRRRRRRAKKKTQD